MRYTVYLKSGAKVKVRGDDDTWIKEKIMDRLGVDLTNFNIGSATFVASEVEAIRRK